MWSAYEGREDGGGWWRCAGVSQYHNFSVGWYQRRYDIRESHSLLYPRVKVQKSKFDIKQSDTHSSNSRHPSWRFWSWYDGWLSYASSYNLYQNSAHESDSWQLKIAQCLCLAGNTQLNFYLRKVSLNTSFDTWMSYLLCGDMYSPKNLLL